MRSLPLYGLGMFFLLVAAGLLALSWRKPKPVSPLARKAELRELEALRKESTKMRVAAGIAAGFGVLLILIS